MNQKKTLTEKKSWQAMGAWSLLVAYMAVLFYLSAQPDLEAPEIFGTQDKFHHLLAYFIFGLIAFTAVEFKPVLRRVSPYIQAFLIGTLYGAFDEYHQSFVPGRTACVLDWAADTAGVTLALVVIAVVQYYKNKGGR